MVSFKKILNHKSETIFGAAMLTGGIMLFGGFLGFLRNALLTSRFGASGNLDIYYASFRLPDMIYNIFIMGAISAAFIPIFSQYWAKDKKEAWQFSNAIILIIGSFVGSLALLVAIFTEPLLSHLLVGFSPEQLEIAVILTRIMMIQPILMGISSVVASVLKIFKLFLVSALAPLFYNLGIIIGILFFVPSMGLKGLAWGVVLGAVLHILVQIPALIGIGYKFAFKLSMFTELKEGLKKGILMMVPRSLGIIVYQVFLLGITAIASMLKEGSIAVFNLANEIQNFPQTVFALSFAIAAFPSLSKLNAEKRFEDFVKTSIDTLLQIFFFLIPIAVWFFVFREPIIRFLYGYGKFDWASTVNTIQVFSILSFGMIFQGVNIFLLRVFFAKGDALRPFIASVISYSTGFFLCYKLGLSFGVIGLTVAVAVTYLFYFLILFFLLKTDVPISLLKKFYHSLGKITVASLLSGSVAYLSLMLLKGIFPIDKVINLALCAFIAFIISFVVFVAFCNWFKIKEIDELKRIIVQKIYGRKR